ncbi:hypothetical protein KR093_009984 [Drosophila rubida]|uniref:Serpin domain-containing protein n=1 Tax=Drosophila rubida TaxID=30044 RepID=A0AAD4K1T0_9MUSC|nr:hypothetical protein KR093_009984 [Drosophila rubida]
MSSLQWKLPVILLVVWPIVSADVVTTLIARVLGRESSTNVIFSPYLVTESLAQLLLGAKGSTLQEIEKALHLPTDSSKSKIINGIIRTVAQDKNNTYGTFRKATRTFVSSEMNLLQDYKDKYNDYFNFTVEKVNFADDKEKTNLIYNWISKSTHIKMMNSMSKLNKNTQIMQIGATYFHGKWKDPFYANVTGYSSFYMPYPQGLEISSIKTMTRKGKYQYMFIEKLDAYAIEIPFADPPLSMLILLPKEVNGTQHMVDLLDTFALSELDPQDTMTNFRITLPKFKIASTVSVKDVLQGLGIKHLFNRANLGDMTTSDKWRVTDIIQKSYIDVDEGKKPEPLNS